MPVDVNLWRARIGGGYKNKMLVFTLRKRYVSSVFTALLFPSPLTFILFYFTVMSSQLRPVILKGVKLRVFNIPFLVVWWLIVPLWFRLILSGDIEVNPGPDKNNKMNGKINFGFWNLNSLLARDGCKIDQIEALQCCNQFDIFGICETWLNDKSKNIEIGGFAPEPIRADSPLANNHPRGGVCLYYKADLPIIHRQDLQKLPECIIAEIKLKNNAKMFFALFYRSPSQTSAEVDDFSLKLSNIINLMNSEKPHLITLCGDFNARSPLLWSGDPVENSAGKHIADLCINNCFEQIIDEPTHVTNDRTPTCIDLILTNNSSAIVDNCVIPSPDPSCKHQIVSGKINLNVPPPPRYKRTVWQYGKGDSLSFKNDIRATDWHGLFFNKSVDQMVDCFTNTFLDLAKKHIPCKIITVSEKDAPWVTASVKTAINRNKRVYRKWVRRGRDPDGKREVNKIQNDTHKIIKAAKKTYIDNLSKQLCDPNCGQKVFWSSYKKLLNKKKNTNIPPIFSNGALISNFKKKAEIFNSYFAKQCTPLENDSTLPDLGETLNECNLGSFVINESDIEKVIRNLNPKKAHGLDGISISLLQMCSKEISIPLKCIFLKSLEGGSYPTSWKLANIQPVHKKKSRQIVENYRPISILPICGKIFEKLIFDSMYIYLTSNSLLSDNQSGYRPNDSCINQLISITSEIFEAFEGYDEVRAVFLDISKAFDKVWYEGLLFKLERCGIEGNLLNLIKNYLHNRKQRVVLNGQESGWETLYSGVPQGSVLGPLLFLVYINDLTDNISSNIKLFADDSSLFVRVRDAIVSHNQIVEDLNTITKWAHQWKMRFNPDITKQAIEIIFSKKRASIEHPSLAFNGIPVAREPSTKHLGVILDSKLSFREHINQQIIKGKKGLALMKFLSKSVSSSVLELTYKMYVRPHLDYGDLIYHNQSACMMDKLESIQYQAALVVSGCWKGTNKVKLVKELGWETLSERREFRRLVLYYKILHNMTPGYMRHHIKPVNETATIRYKNSFFPFCMEKWESLSAVIKNAVSISRFKNLYKGAYFPLKRSFFSTKDGWGKKCLFRLRVNFSDLKAHRFKHRFNCDSPECNCDTGEESTEHYLILCPLFSVQRRNLLNDLTAILIEGDGIPQGTRLVSLILYGDHKFNDAKNKLILDLTIKYILETKRFKSTPR